MIMLYSCPNNGAVEMCPVKTAWVLNDILAAERCKVQELEVPGRIVGASPAYPAWSGEDGRHLGFKCLSFVYRRGRLGGGGGELMRFA